jgi:hypothetical protein
MAYAQVCMIPMCGEKSDVRLRDPKNIKRVDVCLAHALVTVNHYGKNVEIVDTWNGVSTDDVTNGVTNLRKMQNERSADES